MEERPCNVLKSFDMIGSKWKLIILNDLMGEEKRFNELKRSTDSSSRTLSRVLKDLQKDGLVNKRIEDDKMASHYSLTEKGESLEPVHEKINEWGEKWLEK
jgi:DNA-binding HxlR family transcriptional regulator